jgi:hypothetical protein
MVMKRRKEKYQKLFIREDSVTARQGKQVYIRKDYRDRILKIIQVVGKNEVSNPVIWTMCWLTILLHFREKLPNYMMNVKKNLYF